jgi:hypothetical protein
MGAWGTGIFSDDTASDIRVEALQVASAGRSRVRRAAARSSTLRLLDPRDVHGGRLDALGKVPQPLPADAAGERDLAAHHQELQHLGDVAVVRRRGVDLQQCAVLAYS